MNKNNGRIQDLLTLACGGGTILIILLIMNRDYPWVGHDYAYFIPHIIDTGLHIRLNGLTIQWYTPSFGGGLPGFPNPQHIEYSLVQVLSLWINPWSAVLISTAGISIVGYYFFYKFLNKNLELNWMASALAAMFFIGNGFYIEHLITGMLGYQLFPLFGVILYVLTDQHHRFLSRPIIMAIVFAMMIHQAGFYLIVILFLSLSITLPLLFLYKPQIINLKRLGWTVALTSILAAALTASKVYATIAFMRHYPRDIFDVYNVGLFQAVLGVIGQSLGVMSVAPILSFAHYNPGIITGILSNLTGAQYGIWETDTGLSPVLIFFLIKGLAGVIPDIRKKSPSKIDRPQIAALVLLIVAVWITFEFATTKGLVYSATKQLPILRSLHINVRFVAAFVTPLIILGAFPLHAFFLRNQRLSYFLGIAFLTTICLFSYFLLSAEIHIRGYDAGMSRAIYDSVQNEKITPVTKIASISVWQGFSEGESSIKPYEPIFGYKLEDFKPQIHLGSILEANNGYFNMTNPESLVFPELNNLSPFERFKVSERGKLETFLGHRQPGWNIPVAQRILNVLSLVTLICVIGVLFIVNVTKTKEPPAKGICN